MERNIKRIGLVNLVVMLLVGLVGFFLARYAQSLAGQIGSFFFGIGFLVSAISYFQIRLEETERLERLELEEMSKARAATSLFEGADPETFQARRSREQFERFFVPTFTVFLFLLQTAAVYYGWAWIKAGSTGNLVEPTIALALYGIFALTLFLLGKYAAGVARIENQRLLRPGSSYVLLGAYICFLIAACIAAVKVGFPKVDLYVARALIVVLALTSIETLLNLIFEIYRPRARGKAAARVVYESRLTGLLGQPEGLISTAAQALDYQFGFKVSETWFYRFLEKAFAWLLLLQLGVLFLSTSFVFIGPGEEGLLERNGRLLSLQQPLQPGPHLKFPWPIDVVRRYSTREIQTFNIGLEKDEDDRDEKTVLWTVSHHNTEFNLLVASREMSRSASTNANERGVPADLLSVGMPVQYRIKNLRDFAYKHTDARALLEKIATREVIRYFVSVDLFELMSSGRERAAQDLHQRIQARADELELGVEIVFLGLQDTHPPVKVAAAFQKVVAQIQENEAKLREAEGYASKAVQQAEGEAAKKVFDAQSYSNTVVSAAAAKALQFTNQIAAFKASPEVFLQRAYLQTISRNATNSRKYILLTTNVQQVINVNLEDKIRSDLLDIQLPTKK